ncbi:MAG: phosphotransferase [Streptosporangiales bacterium]|nr:phosphotransferase [Streptosporangiales bacterium]
MTEHDQTARARYLAETAQLLWPPPAVVNTGPRNGNRVVSEFLVLPSLADARLLLPLRARRAAAAVALRYAEPRSLGRKARAHAMSLATSTGVAQALFRSRLRIELPLDEPSAELDTVETLLCDVLGEQALVGLHLTRPRANRKPVVQALTTHGQLRAVAKIGTGDLTRSLVAAEERNLRMLGRQRTTTFAVPRVLDFRSWRGLLVLTVTALPVDAPRAPAAPARLAGVASEIAATATTAETVARESRYVAALRVRIGRLRQPAAQQLRQALDAALDAAGDGTLRFGAWHGDFTRANLAVLHDKVLVWDWERYGAGVPVGYDLAHYYVQHDILARHDDVSAYLTGLIDRSPNLLAPMALDRDEATLVIKLYLVEIATRYVADRQDEMGELHDVLPELLEFLAGL